MEALLTPEVLLTIGGIITTALIASILFGLRKLIKMIEESENKIDDTFLPALKEIEARLDAKEEKKEVPSE